MASPLFHEEYHSASWTHPNQSAEIAHGDSLGVTGTLRLASCRIGEKMQTPQIPAALSVSDAAVQMGISRATVYRLLRGGDLPSLKIGSRRLIRRDALNSFLEAMSDTKGNADCETD